MAVTARIGRFEIQDEVGSGASGTIYQALDTETGQRVAVKRVRPQGRVDEARFAREVRVLSRINHPGVVRYIDHTYTPEGEAYLVMEWLEGEDLRERLRHKGLTMNEAVAMARHVAGALEAVHAAGLVHRDVKPGNIFLRHKRAEEAMVIDFGLARADEASTAVTQTGLVVGTPAYMAPEQARGQRDVDGRADLFALGAVLYKCLAGRAPFEGSSVMAVLTKVILEDPPRLRVLRSDMPPAIDELVASLLQKEPGKRPARAADVEAALAALGPLGPVGESTEAAPSSRAFSGLTGGEQRVMAMLFVGPGEEAVPASGLRSTDEALALEPAVGSVPVPAEVGALAREHGGQVDRLANGTSVVTLAGVGVATDQAARAAKLALALREKLPGVPMALATGRGDVATRFPLGDAIDRAARLLGRSAEEARAAVRVGGPAVPAIAVDQVTANLLGTRFHVISGDHGLSLQGPREPDVSGRTLLGHTTPLVGREWELSSLETLFFDAVEDPHARPVLVTASAGMGKSRLGTAVVQALTRRVQDLEVWVGRGDPLRSDSALGLLADVLRSAFGLQDGEPRASRRRRIAQRVQGRSEPATDGRRPSSLPPTADFLGELVDARFPDDSSSALRAARQDPRLMSDQIRAAWESFLDAATAARPLLIVLEDLHWADLATVRLFDETLSRLERRPWMVLGLARPEVHSRFPRLWIDRHVQEIRLKPLPKRAAEKLVRQVLGEVDAATVGRILGKAEGNAFYLEELIRAVALDAASPKGSAPSPGAADLPETVLAMVHARLEGVDPESRRVLRAASVFGDVFWTGGVAALLGEALPDGWEEALVSREWLVKRPESRFAGERELAFRHGLLREGAYATLTETDRALGHRLAGEWLEAHGEPDVMVLAQHFDLAEGQGQVVQGEGAAAESGAVIRPSRARAAELYLGSAAQALRCGDPDAAIARADRALARLPVSMGDPQRVPQTPPGTPEASPQPDDFAARALIIRAEAHAWRNEWGPAAADADEVARQAPPGSVRWIQAKTILQTASFVSGRPLDGLAALAALAGVSPSAETAGAVGPALTVGLLVLCLAGQFEVARGVLDRAAEMARCSDDSPPWGWYALGRTFWALWRDGDPWTALGQARTARAHFVEAGDVRHASFAQIFEGLCLGALGLHADAEGLLRALPASGSEQVMVQISSLYLAAVLIERGALAEAGVLVDEWLGAATCKRRTGGTLREAEALWLLGEIAHRSGDLETADRELVKSLEGLRIVSIHWQVAAARLASVWLAQGRVEEALSLAREARQAQRAQGGRGQRWALIQLVHAEALAAAGQHEASHAEIRDAHADLQQRAGRIDDRAVRRAYLEDVPEHARLVALAASLAQRPS